MQAGATLDGSAASIALTTLKSTMMILTVRGALMFVKQKAAATKCAAQASAEMAKLSAACLKTAKVM